MSNTKKEVAVTVVVPCYNSEAYIRRTMDSICNQTFSDYDVIVVNDGSTDNTMCILEEFQERYKNVHVISKSNDRGWTTVRRGLEQATGQYICVIDNDDIICEKFLEKMYDAVRLNDADMAVCGFQRENRDVGKVYSREMKSRKEIVDVTKDDGVLLEINTALWNKIIRREVYAHLLETGPDLCWMDLICLAYMYPHVNRIAFVDEVLYYYQVKPKSVINNLKKESIDYIYNGLIEIHKKYQESCKRLLGFLDAFAFEHVGVSLQYRMYLSKERNFSVSYSENIGYLNANFPNWLSNRYVSLKYVIKKRRNIKLLVCKIFYRLHLFKPFIATYSFMVSKLGMDIKW